MERFELHYTGPPGDRPADLELHLEVRDRDGALLGADARRPLSPPNAPEH